jgi:hypothetical protein
MSDGLYSRNIRDVFISFYRNNSLKYWLLKGWGNGCEELLNVTNDAKVEMVRGMLHAQYY